MTPLSLYPQPLALLTDLYQLTMAYGYWKLGFPEREAVFHASFRSHPFQGGFSIACGLGTVLDFLDRFRFMPEDLAYLATLQGHDERPLFEPAFLEHLRDLRLNCDIDAIPEGTAVFPFEPLIRVQGPILQCQLLETALLNMLNFPTLIATKAARICLAAQGEPVLEFGLRRAQGLDGALTASRAAFIGGCAATSNVLAGQFFGIPVKGTHAHSWVMCFESELAAFEAYADVMPHNCLLLVDTYDTLDGVRNAIEIARLLQSRGKKFLGIRLDSGDLAYLSIEARRMLDEAGFADALIVASNDLDEDIIRSLKDQDAQVNVWGVGTKLVTAYQQPALGGVYKLSALRGPDENGQPGPWHHKIKLSEQILKTSVPGRLQVRRQRIAGQFRADMIYDELAPPAPGAAALIIDPLDDTRRKVLAAAADGSADAAAEDLLIPIYRRGKRVYDSPPLAAIRQRTADQIAALHPTIVRPVNPHAYPVGLEKSLFDRRHAMILEARGLAV
jgi:nicotinate phosphoribosyltransferase